MYKMGDTEFKEMYLLYRQQNMTLIDLRIIYGKHKAADFEKELAGRTEAINGDESIINKYDVLVEKARYEPVDFSDHDFDKDKAKQ